VINSYTNFIKNYKNFLKSENYILYNKTFKNVIPQTPSDLEYDGSGNLITYDSTRLIINISDFGIIDTNQHSLLIFVNGLLVQSNNISIVNSNSFQYISIKHEGTQSVTIDVILLNQPQDIEDIVFVPDNDNKGELIIDIFDYDNMLDNNVLNYSFKIASLDDIKLYIENDSDFMELTKGSDYNIKYLNHTDKDAFRILSEILSSSPYNYNLESFEIKHDIFHKILYFLRDDFVLTHINTGDNVATIRDKQAKMTSIMNEYYRRLAKYSKVKITVETENNNITDGIPIHIINTNSAYRNDIVLTDYMLTNGVNGINSPRISGKIINICDTKPVAANYNDNFKIYLNGELLAKDLEYQIDNKNNIIFNNNIILKTDDVVSVIRIGNCRFNANINHADIHNYSKIKTPYSSIEVYDRNNSNTDYMDSVFNNYGFFILHTPVPVGNKNFMVYIDGMLHPSKDIDIIKDNLIYIKNIDKFSRVQVFNIFNHNEAYIESKQNADPDNSFEGNYLDNINLEKVVSYSDVFLSEYSDKRYNDIITSSKYTIVDIGEYTNILYKYLDDYREHLNVFGDIYNYIASNGGFNEFKFIPINNDYMYILNQFNSKCIRFRSSVNRLMNTFYGTNISIYSNNVDFEKLNDIIAIYGLDLNDYRIKNINSLELDITKLYAYDDDTYIQFKNNEISDFSTNWNIRPYYINNSVTDYPPQYGGFNYVITSSDKRVTIDLTNNPLSVQSIANIRAIYLYNGVDVIFDDTCIVFQDKYLREGINKNIVSLYNRNIVDDTHLPITNIGLFVYSHRFFKYDDYEQITKNNDKLIYDNVNDLTNIDISEDYTYQPISDLTGIDKCYNLKSIHIVNQNITVVNNSWKQLSLLTILNLGNNSIDDLSFIKYNKRLVGLYVGGNNFTTYDFTRLVNLKYLDVSDSSYGLGNNTDEFIELEKNNNIVELDVSRTNVMWLSRLLHIHGLKKLLADGNNLTDSTFTPINTTIRKDLHIHELNVLSLKNNNFTTTIFMQHFPLLQELYLDNNINLNPTVVIYNNMLHRLSFNKTTLSSLVADTNVYCNNLQYLDVSNSGITSIADIDIFFNPDHFEYFDARNTLISEVLSSDIVDRFNKDTIIDLRGCELISPTQDMLYNMCDNGWNILFDKDALTITTPMDDYIAVIENPDVGDNGIVVSPHTLSLPMNIPEYVSCDVNVTNFYESIICDVEFDIRSENIALETTVDVFNTVVDAIDITMGLSTYVNIGEVVEIDAAGNNMINMGTSVKLTLFNGNINTTSNMMTTVRAGIDNTPMMSPISSANMYTAITTTHISYTPPVAALDMNYETTDDGDDMTLDLNSETTD